MSARLRAVAQQTEQIVAAGAYTAPGGHRAQIAEAVAAARAGTRMFGPGPVEAPRRAPGPTVFEVTGESSLEAARRLVEGPLAGDASRVGEGPRAGEGSPVAVLNFSSARNPGGGYLNGAQAQEEAICRASALYACLLEARPFYDHHRAHRDPFYTDRVIHSPGVPVFRDDSGELLDAPYRVGFLTSAAPNAGVIRRRLPERAADIPQAVAARAERVLETALACGYERLVLGAWGCGVFMNDPAHVAGAFRTLLGEGGRFAGQFAHIVFGVLDRTKGAVTRGAFERTFAQEVTAGRGAEVLSASRNAP
ncbi:TIGR02452 family protein [Streptomyces sp. BG9H]|uniref:TIGR02452 family protein n=1 Tax=Streptomyces anatolicus TaxID=2675858 RepID=A0ABS6YFY4_9ACTN|nr:TIGR02452 family protein [Streptomyces anatolicus]MBW5420333.1 TIGR02452 family protein [Streptomyces anatolicus]